MLRPRSLLSSVVSAVVLVAMSYGTSSCASYNDDVKAMNSAFRIGNYSGALQTFEKSGIKEQERNRLLYLLEKGMIEDRLGERESSRKLWLTADKVVDQLYTKSMSKEAASFVYNDSAQAYPGEDYEKVAIHTMLAHSFLSENDLAAARVEAARINSRLDEINGFYKDNKNKYRDDAYARYLSGMIYEANGEFDSAIVDYRNALKIYSGDYAEIFKVEPPKELLKALYRLLLQRDRKDEAKALASKYKEAANSIDSEAASLIIVHEVGVINEKIEKDFVIPWGKGVLRFSFPIVKRESVARRPTGFRLNEGSFESAELAQNFNTIAYENLEDRRLRTIAKGLARVVVKDQLAQQAGKEFGPLGGLAVSIFGAITETADTRQWTTLPAGVFVSRRYVKAGDYDLEITNNGRVKELKKIRLRPGQVRIVRDGGSIVDKPDASEK